MPACMDRCVAIVTDGKAGGLPGDDERVRTVHRTAPVEQLVLRAMTPLAICTPARGAKSLGAARRPMLGGRRIQLGRPEVSSRRTQGTDDHQAHQRQPAIPRNPVSTQRSHLASLRRSRRRSPVTPPSPSRPRELGQVLPIFAVMSIVLLGGAALLTDVAWWWTVELRMKSAADAAALAGAIYLPGNESLAFAAARSEATKNGYTSGVSDAVVTPRRDPDDPRKLIVDIDAPVQTNFARVFCWQGGPCLETVDVGVTGAASYVLPVPMGSPQNYYGVGFFQGVIPGTTTTTPGSTAWLRPSGATSGSWNDAAYAFVPDENPSSVRYARRQTNPANSDITHEYGGFGASVPAGAAVTGIEVGMQAYASDTTGCQVSGSH